MSLGRRRGRLPPKALVSLAHRQIVPRIKHRPAAAELAVIEGYHFALTDDLDLVRIGADSDGPTDLADGDAVVVAVVAHQGRA